MCLEALGHVVKDTLEGHLTRDAREVLEVLGDLVPDREEFIRRGVFGRFDGVVLDNKRIELDDLAMRVEHVDGELTPDTGGERINDGVFCLPHTYRSVLSWYNIWR
jgi:hypothetical protein